MGICKFDRARLFGDDDWDGEWNEHHADAETWARCVAVDQCPICVTLWQILSAQMKTTLPVQSALDVARRDQVLLGDDYVRVLREALDACVGSWPFYHARLRKLANGDFLLNFQQIGTLNVPSNQKGYSLIVQNFLVYPADDDDSEGPGFVGNSTKSLQSFKRVKNWVEHCDAGAAHPHCKVLSPSQGSSEANTRARFMPTRLLFVGTSDNPVVRLVEGFDEEGIVLRYTTLSHCWGDPKTFQPLRLLETNKKDLLKEVVWESLAQTFQDAIIVTRRLGVEHIWIDSLCIVQEDEKDWHNEAPRMEKVYGNSYVNLAAVDSTDGRGGLFRDRNPSSLGPVLINANSFLLNGKYKVVQRDFWNAQLLDRPLYRRGWVFQERMLAPRILHYSKEQIFWQCLSMSACETAPDGLPSSIDAIPSVELKWRRAFHTDKLTKTARLSLNELFDLQLDESWKAAVKSYTSCNLTFAKDRLMALSGVASVMKAAFEERYLAGLWGAKTQEDIRRSNLPEQLGWKILLGQRADGSPSLRFSEYCAPSWSWASVDGVVALRDRFHKPRDYEATIISANTTLRDTNTETGRVDQNLSELCLRGLVIRLSLTVSHTRSAQLEWRPPLSSGKAMWCHAWLDEGVRFAGPGSLKAGETSQFIIVLLTYKQNRAPVTPEGATGHGILIEPAPMSPRKFVRIGVLEFTSLSEGAFRALLSDRVLNLDVDEIASTQSDGEGVLVTLV